jgi:uncharacterized protein
MNKLYQYKSLNLEIKDIDRKQGIVKGYLSAFNVKDSDGDIILPGAFKKSIDERGPGSTHPRIKWFIDHDPTQVPGVFKHLSEDTYGLAYEGQVGTHALGQDFMKMAESGIITEHSHGFRTIKEEKKADANYMSELFLMEGSSLKAWGANQYTPITGVKSEIKIEQISNRITRLEKFVKNTDATDECIESLMIEIKQLSQLLIDIVSQSPSTTPAAEKAQEPEKEAGYLLMLDLNLKTLKGI